MLEILVMSFIAGASTLIGSGIVMAGGRPTQRSLGLFLGAAAGIMTGVVLFDLLPSAITYGSAASALVGSAAGFCVLFILDNLFRVVMHCLDGVNYNNAWLRLGILIAIGIALHDLPEGIAIAAGYSAETELGIIIALAITLHNIPEGMACTAPLWMGGVRRRQIVMMIIAISFITPLGALAGVLLVNVSPGLLSSLLAFAAGAMTYIVSIELIPEAVRCGWLYSGAGAAAGLAVIKALSGI
ncbi:MAG TPA: ZIP family metal transporter [Clostridia bacterium]|jgi:ZIP family zinc transporter|nr:ZIP family metal transporter [Clostridia bacterium]